MKHPMKQHQTLSIQRPYTSVVVPSSGSGSPTWAPQSGGARAAGDGRRGAWSGLRRRDAG